jgi:tetratricopeptide (TPR) repeat protein
MTRSSKHTLAALVAALLLAACGAKPAVRPDPPAREAAGKPEEPVKAPDPTKSPAEQFEDALASMKAKKLKEARAGFELLAREHPEFAGPLTNLAILDAKANNREAAIDGFTKAVAANPRNAVAYNWLGILYREARNYPKAEESYLKSLELNPDNAAVVLNLAILYDLYLKRPADALARYRDYQRMTNNRELKVTAWIKALEAAEAPPAAPAAPPATPTPAGKS